MTDYNAFGMRRGDEYFSYLSGLGGSSSSHQDVYFMPKKEVAVPLGDGQGTTLRHEDALEAARFTNAGSLYGFETERVDVGDKIPLRPKNSDSDPDAIAIVKGPSDAVEQTVSWLGYLSQRPAALSPEDIATLADRQGYPKKLSKDVRMAAVILASLGVSSNINTGWEPPHIVSDSPYKTEYFPDGLPPREDNTHRTGFRGGRERILSISDYKHGGLPVQEQYQVPDWLEGFLHKIDTPTNEFRLIIDDAGSEVFRTEIAADERPPILPDGTVKEITGFMRRIDPRANQVEEHELINTTAGTDLIATIYDAFSDDAIGDVPAPLTAEAEETFQVRRGSETGNIVRRQRER